MIAELTGMDVANASMYDGSTGAAEAVMMAVRVTGRHKAVVAATVHPEYREVLHDLRAASGLADDDWSATIAETGRVDLAALDAAITDETAAVLVQSPNFFGVIEDIPAIAEIAHAKGALLIVSIAEAVSLGVVASARRGRYRQHGGAVVRRRAQLRRALLRRHRGQGAVPAPDARPSGRPDRRQQRQPRLRAHACPPASSTSAAKRRPRTSAPIRHWSR